MNLEAVKISRCPLPPERSWPRGWAETGRWSPLADQWGCVRLYTPLDSPLNNASSFSIRGPQTPVHIWPLGKTVPSRYHLLLTLLPTSFSTGHHLPSSVGPPSVHGAAAAYYCRSFDLRGEAGGWRATGLGLLRVFQRKTTLALRAFQIQVSVMGDVV